MASVKNGVPVVFAAFVNDRVNSAQNLEHLRAEAAGLRAAFEKLRERGLCEPVVRENVSVDDLIEEFGRYGNRIALFHFAGHADEYRLFLESKKQRQPCVI